jgi:decaprenylphospho-beta-D-ribofuranose 2-oxidase
VINKLSVKAFNEVWFRKAPRRRQGELQSIPTYFHPLDLVGNWNRVYGAQGFVQYQFVVPYDAEGVLRTIIERLAVRQLPIFMTVLKRFGPGNPAPLSFPAQGWQLAVDIGVSQRGISGLLAGFDRLVLDAGGPREGRRAHRRVVQPGLPSPRRVAARASTRRSGGSLGE